MVIFLGTQPQNGPKEKIRISCDVKDIHRKIEEYFIRQGCRMFTPQGTQEQIYTFANVLKKYWGVSDLE